MSSRITFSREKHGENAEQGVLVTEGMKWLQRETMKVKWYYITEIKKNKHDWEGYSGGREQEFPEQSKE